MDDLAVPDKWVDQFDPVPDPHNHPDSAARRWPNGKRAAEAFDDGSWYVTLPDGSAYKGEEDFDHEVANGDCSPAWLLKAKERADSCIRELLESHEVVPKGFVYGDDPKVTMCQGQGPKRCRKGNDCARTNRCSYIHLKSFSYLDGKKSTRRKIG